MCYTSMNCHNISLTCWSKMLYSLILKFKLSLTEEIKVPVGRELVAIGIFATFIVALLVIGVPHFFSQDTSSKSYSVSLNGQSVYSNYPLSAFVDNSQIINIFGLDQFSNDNITLTELIGETSNIKSTNIKYNVYPKINPQNYTEPNRINLTVGDTKPGLFQGLVMIEARNNNLTSFPLTLTSENVTNYAVIWILVGVFSSFIFWEFIKVNQKKNGKKNLLRLRGQTKSLSNSNEIVENIVERIKYERINDYLDSRYTTRAGVGRIAFVDIVSVAFGVALGFIGLLNNDYVTSLRFISFETIIILIGLGLGIGSIKGIG